MTNDESADLLIWRQKHHLSGFRTKVESDNIYFEPAQKIFGWKMNFLYFTVIQYFHLQQK